MRRQSQKYVQLVRVVSSLLYAHDPDGMGRSVSAPLDEYDDIAARHIAELVKLDSGAVVERLRESYSDAPGLAEAIAAALALYQHTS